MKQPLGVMFLLWIALRPAVAAKEYDVSGMVVTVDRGHRTFTASIQAIPGFMPAMLMPFEVRDVIQLDGLMPGATVQFMLVVAKASSHAERIRVVQYRSIEQDPLAVSRLKLLTQLSGAPPPKALAVGDIVPDFTLINQKSEPVALSDTRGKVVAINFIYTSCALPNFCLRIANNFGVLQQRFRDRIGRDLMLLTITFDPIHDSPSVLAQYARHWNADSRSWHFLTGSAADVMRVCRLFGVDSFPDEGLMNHSLRTAIVDRQGKLVANIEGNQFTARQLADLAQTVLYSKERR